MTFLEFLFVHESIHLATSAVTALILYSIFRNRLVFIMALIAGMVIDVDHLFDYFLDYLRLYGPVLNLDKLIPLFGNYMRAAGKIYVPFHSLDLLWVWWFVGRYLNSLLRVKGMEWALIFPLGLHILVDHATYLPHPLAYFFFYRLTHNFSRDSFNGL